MEPPETSDWVAIIDRLGPGAVILLVLVGLVGWVARQMLTSGASVPSPARDIGRLEGLIEGMKDRIDALERHDKDRLDAHEKRIGDLEKEPHQ